jgi:protein TonB
MTDAMAAPMGGPEPRGGMLWGAAFAVVLAAHVAVGLALLQAAPETGPVEAAQPIAMIDLPPLPVLPDAVAAVDVPAAEADAVPPPEMVAIGGSVVPDIAPEAPEPIQAPLAAAEQLPPETVPPPPVPTVRPAEAVPLEAPPPEAVATAAAETAPPLETAEAPPVPPAEAVAVEPPLEAAPVVPDAAVALPGPVALPPAKPDVPPPAVRAPPPATAAKRPETKTTEAKPQKPAAQASERKTAEKPAAKRQAGPAADTAKAGARPQSAASAPRAAGGGPVADILKQYQAKVRADIEREVRRLPVSRTGVTTIRFSFSRAGALAGATVARSSGDPTLDRAALTAVKRANPLPAAPPELSQASFTMTVPIRLNAR